MEVLSSEQCRFYDENGYLVLEAHLSDDIISQARDEIARMSEHAATISSSDDLIDVEDSHNPQSPRIRRIKRPDLQSEFFNSLPRWKL